MTLPAGYRDFLERNNGGYLEGGSFEGDVTVDPVCVSVAAGEAGTVYLWDHEIADPEAAELQVAGYGALRLGPAVPSTPPSA